MIAVRFQNVTKPVNTLCGQNVELLIVKAGGEYTYRWLLKDWKIMILHQELTLK
jgi:hypothetical protein